MELGDGLAALTPKHAVVPHHERPAAKTLRGDAHKGLTGQGVRDNNKNTRDKKQNTRDKKKTRGKKREKKEKK